jgi:hypothetical protein
MFLEFQRAGRERKRRGERGNHYGLEEQLTQKTSIMISIFRKIAVLFYHMCTISIEVRKTICTIDYALVMYKEKSVKHNRNQKIPLAFQT